MRRTLGTSLALTLSTVLLLTGCQQENDGVSPGDTVGTDPAPSSTPSPTPAETPTSTQTDGDAAEPVDYEVVALPSATAAGGQASSMLTPVETPGELKAFVSQIRLDDFAEEVTTAATTATYDGKLWAAIVSLGCDVPPGVSVEEGEAGYLVTPDKGVDPLQECLAAVTTVALVAIR